MGSRQGAVKHGFVSKIAGHGVSYWGLATAGRPAGIVARHRDYGLFSDILAQSDKTNCRTKFVPWNLTEEAVCYLLVASAFLHL